MRTRIKSFFFKYFFVSFFLFSYSMIHRIGSGAEAVVEREDAIVRKTRLAKSYRHPDLDARLRRFRTRREAKILGAALVRAPRLLSVDDSSMVIEMEFLNGAQLRDVVTAQNASVYAQQLGLLVRSLHDAGVCHGDLTTSNVLVVGEELFLVDFGLSFFSDSLEDQAVDLHVLKHALDAKHPSLKLWVGVLAAYNASDALLARFEEVESRGRYKGH